MCTLVVMSGIHREHPLVVVANRDEAYGRASAGPLVLGTSPRIVGGRDLASGGTWRGVNEHGLFVGLTNQRSWEPADPRRRSRGLIVMEALAARDAYGVVELLARHDARTTNGFNLAFGTPAKILRAYARPERREVEIEDAPEALFVLANDRVGSPEFPKAERAEALARAALARGEGPAQMATLLADHDQPPLSRIAPPPPGARFGIDFVQRLQALCIHTETYGTVSSTTLAWGVDGRVSRYLFAGGPPCTHAHEDVSGLLA